MLLVCNLIWEFLSEGTVREEWLVLSVRHLDSYERANDHNPRMRRSFAKAGESGSRVIDISRAFFGK